VSRTVFSGVFFNEINDTSLSIESPLLLNRTKRGFQKHLFVPD
jgi:hypothetical protein